MRPFLFINTLTLFLFYSCSQELENEHPVSQISETERSELKIKLGRYFFYDPDLSIDSTVSCASCHQQEFAFSDGRTVAMGVHQYLGKRNVPSLSTVRFSQHLNWDGGATSFNMQALIPIEDTTEMGINIVVLAERLNQNKRYKEWAKQAFNRKVDPYVITQSLQCFLESFPSKLTLDTSSFSKLEKKGYTLFYSEKINCIACHKPPEFGYNEFSNNGLLATYSDPGRFAVSQDSSDLYRYRIPGLWNVSMTTPYLHNGSIPSLDSLLKLYAIGGQSHQFQDQRLKNISLSSEEQMAIKAFLLTLVDSSTIIDEKLSNPFK